MFSPSKHNKIQNKQQQQTETTTEQQLLLQTRSSCCCSRVGVMRVEAQVYIHRKNSLFQLLLLSLAIKR